MAELVFSGTFFWDGWTVKWKEPRSLTFKDVNPIVNMDASRKWSLFSASVQSLDRTLSPPRPRLKSWDHSTPSSSTIWRLALYILWRIDFKNFSDLTGIWGMPWNNYKQLWWHDLRARWRLKEGASIERLPTELMESIFLQSLNHNLLLASPRIATQLSKSEKLFKAVFFIAFFTDHLNEWFKHIYMTCFKNYISSTLTSSHLRSLTKAIFRSRWCTWKYVQDLLGELLTAPIDTTNTITQFQ